jgi:hypothetical protein
VVTHGDELSVVEGGIKGEGALPYFPISRDDDGENATGGDPEDLKMLQCTHARSRVLDEGYLVSNLREETDGTLHNVVDVNGFGEEGF